MEKTTNISELPIQSNIPPIESSEMGDKLQSTTEHFTIDQDVLHTQREKQVKFLDEEQLRMHSTPDTKIKKESDLFTISDELKLIALASLMFFIFIDNKFKKYIINILTQMFGEFIKSETGGTSKIGHLVYTLTFGLVLYSFAKFVDYTTLQFDFLL
jgi:hypothetical protein